MPYLRPLKACCVSQDMMRHEVRSQCVRVDILHPSCSSTHSHTKSLFSSTGTSRLRHVEENLILRFRWKTLPENAERERIVYAAAASELRVVNQEMRVRDCLILILTSQLFVLRGRRHVLCHHIHFSDILDVEQREEEERVVFQFRIKQGQEESTLSFRMNRSEAATFGSFW